MTWTEWFMMWIAYAPDDELSRALIDSVPGVLLEFEATAISIVRMARDEEWRSAYVAHRGCRHICVGSGCRCAPWFALLRGRA